ncbi:hypothetical protein J1614_004508 [Plenodomus biglobosus]|nr:hypothetical protein J1614_004508 [Plenodomus biglobosus]
MVGTSYPDPRRISNDDSATELMLNMPGPDDKPGGGVKQQGTTTAVSRQGLNPPSHSMSRVATSRDKPDHTLKPSFVPANTEKPTIALNPIRS